MSYNPEYGSLNIESKKPEENDVKQETTNPADFLANLRKQYATKQEARVIDFDKEPKDDKDNSRSRSPSGHRSKRRRSRSRSRSRSRHRHRDRRSRSRSRDRRRRSRSRDRDRRSSRHVSRSIFRDPEPRSSRGFRGDDKYGQGTGMYKASSWARERNSRSLFVRGIPYNANDAELAEVPLFRNCKEIRMAMDPLDNSFRGFAHIEYETERGADKAIREYDRHGLNIMGSDCFVDFVGHKARTSPADRAAKKNRTLFIRSIPYDTTLQMLREAPILRHARDIRMAYDDAGEFRGFAHVEFESQKDADEAITYYDRNSFKILNKTVYVDYCGSKARQTEQDRLDRKNRTIFVRSIPYDATEEIVRAIPCFRQAKDIRMAHDDDGAFRGFCHVEFATQAEADSAIVYYDERGLNILGKTVYADYVGDNARQSIEDREAARIKAEQKRAKKRESDALAKLLTGKADPGSLEKLIAQAKGNVTAPNIAQNLNRMAGGSVDIKAAAKAMDLHAMENAGNYQQEFTDIDDNADNYRGECIVKLDGKIISKSQGGAVYAHGRGGRYNNNYNRGNNQNDWSNAAMKQNMVTGTYKPPQASGWGDGVGGWNSNGQGNSQSNWGNQANAPKKPNPNMGGLLM